MAVQKAISSDGFNNGGAFINPNSLKLPPSTPQRLVGDTHNLAAAASGTIHDRFNDPRYYTGDTSS